MLRSTHRLNMVIISKSDFKQRSYGPDRILLQGYAETLTFKVATQMLRATRRLNMVVISVKKFRNSTLNSEVMGRTRMGRTDGLTDGRTDKVATICSPEIFLGIIKTKLKNQGL